MKRKIFLRFPKALVTQPVTYTLVKDFGLRLNIFSALVTPEEAGQMGIEVEGERGAIDGAIKKIRSMGISVDSLEKRIRIDRRKCQDCGACISVCPAKAISFGRDYAVSLEKGKCIACALCVDACPFLAISREE
jgi:ferredoxin